MLGSFCGIRLNTAGVIIGWIGAVLSLLTIVLISLALGYLDELVKSIVEQANDPNFDAATARTVLLIGLCIYLTTNAINLVASALLVAGTVKERHLLLVPWLLNAGFSLLLSCIYFVGILTTSAPFASMLPSLIFGGIGLVFNFYIWYAIYSLYKQIQATRDQQQRLIPATSAGASYPSYTKI